MFLRISIGAVLAFGMEVSEFLVLSRTSSLTLSVAGVLKEICQLVLAVETKGDQLSAVNVVGLVLCLGGIACHVIHKYSVFRQSGSQKGFAEVEHGESGMSGGGGEDDHGLGSPMEKAEFGFRYRNNNKSEGKQKLLDQSSPLLDTDEDEDVELFQANGAAAKAKIEKEDADAFLSDILQRRDQRR